MASDGSARQSASGFAATLADALRYPFGESALLTNVVLVALRLLALLFPGWDVLLHLGISLGLYNYAMEALAASAAGRKDPPEGWSRVDSQVHVHHYWLQLLLLVALLAATRLAPAPLQPGLLALLALALPGAVMALALSQNLSGALNPLYWLRIAGQLGVAYLGLAVAAAAVLWLQGHGGEWIERIDAPLIAVPVYYFVAQHLTLSLFRLMGLAIAGSPRLIAASGLQAASGRPEIARDREEADKQQIGATARASEDPRERARQLALLLPRGVADEHHQEYRRCLRELGDRDGLLSHARSRTCELLALAQPRAAVALASEGRELDPAFALPDAASTVALAAAAERFGLVRQAAEFLANYRQAFPKRFDGFPLALQAATLFANRLQQPERALGLLRAAEPLAAAGAERGAVRSAIEQLQRGETLSPFAPERRP